MLCGKERLRRAKTQGLCRCIRDHNLFIVFRRKQHVRPPVHRSPQPLTTIHTHVNLVKPPHSIENPLLLTYPAAPSKASHQTSCKRTDAVLRPPPPILFPRVRTGRNRFCIRGRRTSGCLSPAPTSYTAAGISTDKQKPHGWKPQTRCSLPKSRASRPEEEGFASASSCVGRSKRHGLLLLQRCPRR